MIKHVILVFSLLLLLGCTTRKERIIHESEEKEKYVEIQGHDFWIPTVGTISGTSNGYTYQIVHLPDCRRCKTQLDSVVRNVVREELLNMKNK